MDRHIRIMHLKNTYFVTTWDLIVMSHPKIKTYFYYSFFKHTVQLPKKVLYKTIKDIIHNKKLNQIMLCFREVCGRLMFEKCFRYSDRVRNS